MHSDVEPIRTHCNNTSGYLSRGLVQSTIHCKDLFQASLALHSVYPYSQIMNCRMQSELWADVFSVTQSVPANISEDKSMPRFYNFWAKNNPLQILIGRTRRAEWLHNLPSSIRENPIGQGLRGELSYLLHICQIEIWGRVGPERPC
jgi:hypothetical protein